MDRNATGTASVAGVILLVGVTVALAVLVTVVAFDLDERTDSPSDATVRIYQTDGDIKALLVRNRNVEELYLQHARGGGFEHT